MPKTGGDAVLTFVEEIVLLMLDDEGAVLPVRETTMEYVIAGAALMDLAFADRIDTDPDELTVIDRAPTGNAMLDRVLVRVSESGENRSAGAWVESVARREAKALREMALDSLIARGILERRDERFLWVFESRRYPIVDGREEREVKLRIAAALLSEDIPDPRDVALICLVDACNVLPDIFSSRETEKVEPRVEQLRKMDLIGREIGSAIAEIERSIMIAMTQTPH